MKLMKTFLKGTALVLCHLLLGAAGAAAHGRESHAHEHPPHHLEEMMRYKEQISEEYRVMNRTPMTPNMSSLRRGKELFATHCAPCHGAGGEGDGPVAAALDAPPASFLDLEHSDIFGPGEKYWVIGNGFPSAGMPAFEGQIAPQPTVGTW
jgi:cytochrome c1